MGTIGTVVIGRLPSIIKSTKYFLILTIAVLWTKNEFFFLPDPAFTSRLISAPDPAPGYLLNMHL